jgi:hypothetical protein
MNSLIEEYNRKALILNCYLNLLSYSNLLLEKSFQQIPVQT